MFFENSIKKSNQLLGDSLRVVVCLTTIFCGPILLGLCWLSEGALPWIPVFLMTVANICIVFIDGLENPFHINRDFESDLLKSIFSEKGWDGWSSILKAAGLLFIMLTIMASLFYCFFSSSWLIGNGRWFFIGLLLALIYLSYVTAFVSRGLADPLFRIGVLISHSYGESVFIYLLKTNERSLRDMNPHISSMVSWPKGVPFEGENVLFKLSRLGLLELRDAFIRAGHEIPLETLNAYMEKIADNIGLINHLDPDTDEMVLRMLNEKGSCPERVFSMILKRIERKWEAMDSLKRKRAVSSIERLISSWKESFKIQPQIMEIPEVFLDHSPILTALVMERDVKATNMNHKQRRRI